MSEAATGSVITGRFIEHRGERIVRRRARPADRLERLGRITRAQAEAGRELAQLAEDVVPGCGGSSLGALLGRQGGAPGGPVPVVPSHILASQRLRRAEQVLGPLLWRMAWRVMVEGAEIGPTYLVVQPGDLAERDADNRGIGLLVAGLDMLVRLWRVVPNQSGGTIRAAYAPS